MQKDAQVHLLIGTDLYTIGFVFLHIKSDSFVIDRMRKQEVEKKRRKRHDDGSQKFNNHGRLATRACQPHHYDKAARTSHSTRVNWTNSLLTMALLGPSSHLEVRGLRVEEAL